MRDRVGSRLTGWLRQYLYPRGGWLRSGKYRWLRLIRISDSPRRIARGVFAGTFVAFTPFFGLHFVLAPVLAWMLGGSMLASLAAVFVCNPFTFPVMAYASYRLGSKMIGRHPESGPEDLVATGVHALREILDNFVALFSARIADWDSVVDVVRQVFLPYLVGGSVLGLIGGIAFGWLSYRLISAYQRRRWVAVNAREGE